MLLTKCYYVVYHVADFAADNESICHQDAYCDHNNALLVAKDLAKCLDVVDDVYVIDGLTGEVLNTILKDSPQEDKTEQDDAPADNTSDPVDTYKDKNGDTWFRISDGRWRIDCTNRHCADCPYYDEEGDCIVQEPLPDVDRNYQVELARQRMLFAKAKDTKEEENSISLSSLGGKDSLWILPLYRNQPRKIILSLYREGWDRDCINQTRGASFLSSISFEIARER